MSPALARFWMAKAEAACKKVVDAQDKLLLALIEGRNKERLALFEKAKARAAAVGADR